MKCFPHNRETTMNNHRSIAQRSRDTQLKEKRLKEKGYVVLSKWSCEFAEEKQKPKVRDFLNTVNIQDPINLRDCYFGGRTNALVLHKKIADGEKGKYVDFTSLYPAILKYRRFPVGHPKRIIKDFQQCLFKPCDSNCFYFPCEGKHWVLPYFGVIKVTVLPPTDLIHHVLPLKCNGKLKFPLCYKCACLQNKEMCKCLDSDRMFTHTYCTPELEVAMNMGYSIIQIYEVLHWEETEVYDHVTKKGGLFTGYINAFFKIKARIQWISSVYHIRRGKKEYIEKYFEHEGILLEKESISKNPGLRSLSDLLLIPSMENLSKGQI